MCRADPDPPRSDGLLCRTVGVAIRARTTHRHRIGNHGPKQHPVTLDRKADMVCRWSRNTFFSQLNNHDTCSSSVHHHAPRGGHRNWPEHRSRSPSRSLPPQSPLLQEAKGHDKGHRRGYRNAIGITRRRLVRPIYPSYSPVYGPMGLPAPWTGWFRFTRITTASGAVAVSGSICRHRSIHHV